MAIESINPSTGELIERLAETSEEEVERALAAARDAFGAWSARPIAERSALVGRAGAVLERRSEELARLVTGEMGKTLREARAEVKKCAWACRYFAEHAPGFLAASAIESSASESSVGFVPLGAVLAIMPWNFPLWQVFRFAAPTLAAGNVALLKHSSNVPRSALAIEEVFRQGGLPDGVFRTLLVSGARAEALIDDPRIAAVTLTGSDAVGERVARRAGGALKKAVLELGGSDPFVVLADADVAAAARAAVAARFQNAGQSCIAAKRFIVERSVLAAFTAAFAAGAAALRVGDPLREDTDMGPLARADLRDAIARQVERTAGAGATVLAGGAVPAGPGFFYPPTVLGGVRPGMAAFDEETFGPVAPIIAADDEADAIALANRTQYGLGASLWTRDLDRARRLAPRIEAGSVFVNGMVASDPRLPFGGVKRSGYGRELSVFGIREFMNVQTRWIGPARDERPTAE